MTQATSKQLTFDQFLEQCLEDGIYELLDGEIVGMRPIGVYENVPDFLSKCIEREIERLALDHVVNRTVVVRTVTKQRVEQGR